MIVKITVGEKMLDALRATTSFKTVDFYSGQTDRTLQMPLPAALVVYNSSTFEYEANSTRGLKAMGLCEFSVLIVGKTLKGYDAVLPSVLSLLEIAQEALNGLIVGQGNTHIRITGESMMQVTPNGEFIYGQVYQYTDRVTGGLR